MDFRQSSPMTVRDWFSEEIRLDLTHRSEPDKEAFGKELSIVNR
jgi:hypothetical protein